VTDRIERQEKLPASDEVTEVAAGIYRMQLPISLPGLGHVNCYALEDANGFTVVDPGLPDPGTALALESRLAQIGAPLRRVHTVFVTHSHPDHFGGAGRLRIANGAAIVAHEHYATIFDPHRFDPDHDAELTPRRPDDGFDPAKFAAALLGDDEIDELPVRRSPWGGTVPFPTAEEVSWMRSWDLLSRQGLVESEPSVRVPDGDVITLGGREWLAVHTPGHTGDHLCLFDPADGVLLSGDHVLPTITPHISGMTTSADSLADFFAALERVASLEGVRLVLPAHGHPFTDLVGRVAAIERHHIERLEELVGIGATLGDASVIDYSHHLFSERSWGAMAESETFAHLEHLRLAGRAHRRRVGEAIHFTVDA
jgi:glyoxylase-like metal-dependent hydrolase (beta-lactamase superfamily II)